MAAGCTPAPTAPSPTPSATQTGGAGQPRATVAEVSVGDVASDPSAGGALTELPVPGSLPSHPQGSFYWIDPFGDLWSHASWGFAASGVSSLDTGASRELGDSLLVGKAAAPGANGIVGESVLSPDGTLVWFARDEGGELAFDSYDVYAWGPQGDPVKIGESTVDWDGNTFAAPGDSNYLTVAGARAYWVESASRADATQDVGYKSYADIYSAPVDGSDPQKIAFDSARFSRLDRCAPADHPRLTYMVDRVSTGYPDTVATLHAATINAAGDVENDDVIWHDSVPGRFIDSVGVCGDTIAVGYKADPDSPAMDHYLTVFRGDAVTSLSLRSDGSSGVGQVLAVPGGVFAFEWDGDKPGQQLFWRASNNTWYVIGTAGTFNIAATDAGHVVMAREAGEPDDIRLARIRAAHGERRKALKYAGNATRSAWPGFRARRYPRSGAVAECMTRFVHRLTAPAPGWTINADVIVVGSGVAGLSAALELRAKVDRVLVVTKGKLASGSTVWAQGGIAAALDPEDTPQEHLDDTLVAGAGLCSESAVRALVTEGPDRVRELMARGANFDTTPNGDITLTREGGHHRDRIVHAGGDATGAEISRALVAQLDAIRNDPGIEVIEGAMVVDLLTAAPLPDGRPGKVCGVTLHVIGQGTRDGVGAALAKAVIVATGGIGQVFRSSTNPASATGDGIATATARGRSRRRHRVCAVPPDGAVGGLRRSRPVAAHLRGGARRGRLPAERRTASASWWAATNSRNSLPATSSPATSSRR